MQEGSDVGVARGDRIVFSVATIDRGRFRAWSEDWEFGRRCQDNGEFLDAIVFDGDAFTATFRLGSGSFIARSPSNGNEFSFVGDVGLAMGFSMALWVVSN